MWWRKNRKNRGKRELIVLLDKDSYERFGRLKAKIAAFDEEEILATALKCLEQRVDKIIKKRVTKRISNLENEGYSPQKIANYLNNKGFPVLDEANKWHSDTISGLLEKEKRNRVDKLRNAGEKRHHSRDL